MLIHNIVGVTEKLMYFRRQVGWNLLHASTSRNISFIVARHKTEYRVIEFT